MLSFHMPQNGQAPYITARVSRQEELSPITPRLRPVPKSLTTPHAFAEAILDLPNSRR